MENNVSRIRDAFYNDLTDEYQTEPNSFLYRYFLAESVRELQEKLKKSLEGMLQEKPEILWPEIGSQIWPKDIRKIRNHLRTVMQGNQEWARGILLREPPGKKDKRERRDFWEELWLNNAGYRAGLITDREYYLWLVEYLEARDIYYKDIGIGNGGNLANAHTWLYTLLYEGLRGTENALMREELVKQEAGTTINIRTKSQVEGDLKKLANLMRSERGKNRAETIHREWDEKEAEPVQDRQDEKQAGSMGEGREPEKEKAVDRMHHLKKKTAKGKDTWYLLWLTQRLERMAIHIKIKTWLQDSGYPLKIMAKEEGAAKKPRKQDFSMRIFEAYIDNHYEFVRKKQGGRKTLEKWHREGEFCVADRNLAEALLTAVRESGNDAVYIPLAVHMFTGCVFFLTGKENYSELYEKGPGKKWKNDYEAAEGCCCFDYLRLGDSSPGDILGAMKMEPFYHRNAGKSYEAVLNDFKLYCQSEASPLQAVRTWNGEMPGNIPDALRWAFDSWEIAERPKSPESVAKFIETKENASKSRPFNAVRL